MVHRTGYLFKEGDNERYIQVETILIFYKQEFISTGKHLLFEDETFIGHITASDGEYVTKGLAVLSEQEKAELILFLTLSKPPLSGPSSLHINVTAPGSTGKHVSLTEAGCA